MGFIWTPNKAQIKKYAINPMEIASPYFDWDTYFFHYIKVCNLIRFENIEELIP